MKKILISAYGCEPSKGSEQGVGWHWAREIAKTYEVWVITRTNNREAIEAELGRTDAARIRFVYFDLHPAVLRRKRGPRGLYWYYFAWQWGAYRRAKRLIREVEFDYCMHLTFGSVWLPTFMYRLPVPFIWGPLGGGESVPPRLFSLLPVKEAAVQAARLLLIALVRFNPLFVGPARSATAIIARTEETRDAFPRRYRHKVWVALETAMPGDLLNYPVNERGGGQTRFVCTGRLVPTKNVALAVRAFAEAASRSRMSLTVVGDGPLRSELEALTKQLGAQDLVQFVGARSWKETISILRGADVFLFPSLKEGGTWSLMEAMALGLPSICINVSGMRVITDPSTAFRLAPSHPSELHHSMVRAIRDLAENADLRKSMGAAARARIERLFVWSQKGVFFRELVEELEKENARECQQHGRSK